MSYYGGWAPYVPVAERRAKALKQLEKMKKKGLKVQPVEIAGRKIAASFWGKGWCDHMESFGDYANRLPRGRSYVRNGSVCHLEIKSGLREAIVSGSSLYDVSITIFPLAIHKWKAIKSSCSGRIGSLIDLLRGKLDRGVMEVVSNRKEGLFPLPGEIKFDCNCPDSAGMCKHIAAVLYGVGVRLDHSPELLFILRGVNHEELIDVSVAVADVGKSGTSRRRIAAGGLADVFGIEIAAPLETDPETVVKEPSSKKRCKAELTSAAASLQQPAPKAPKKVALKKAPAPQKTVPEISFPEPLTGNIILSWRTSLGDTQTEFAARINCASPSVCQWEKKGTAPLGMQQRTLFKLKNAWKKTHV